MRFLLLLLTSVCFAAPGSDPLAAARSARDLGDLAALQSLIGQSQDLVRTALLNDWLCEALYSVNDTAGIRRAAQAGLAAAEKAVQLQPESSEAHRLVGDLLGQLIPHVFAGGMRYGARSTRELEKALQLDPRNAEAHISRATSYLFTPEMFGGGKEKALQHLRTALELDPQSDTAHLWMAQVFDQMHQKDRALGELDAAMRINPNRGYTRYLQKQMGGSAARFDLQVREDIFAGMLGDRVRLERGLRFCEAELRQHPDRPEALVWHGSGLMTLSSLHYADGKAEEGDRAWTLGLGEVNRGRALAPKNLGVLIGRSALLIGIAQSGFDPADREARELLASAVSDYEFVLQQQRPTLDQLSLHSRCELLFGLAAGWSRLDQPARTRDYLAQIMRHCSGSSYESEAKVYLAQTPIPAVDHNCTGCHVTKR